MARLTCYLWMVMSLLLSGCAASPGVTSGNGVGLTILTEDYAPLNFEKNGKVTGLSTEVVDELVKRTDTSAAIRVVPWEEGYKAVLEQPNTALFTTMMTTERKARLQWVGPIAVVDTNLYVLKGAGTPIKTLDEAKSLGKIATVTDYYSEQMLKKEGFANLQSYPDEAAAARALLSGGVQLLVSNNIALPAVLNKLGATMNDVEIAFTVSTDLGYIAFSRTTSQALVARWQAKLDEMKRDGSFNAIYKHWLPAEVPPDIFQFVTEEYPPITFMKEGRPSGFVTDMVREIASRMHIADNIRLTYWKNAYNLALLNPNVILFSAERTPEREKLFYWVGPVGKNSAILFAKKGSGIRVKSLEEARHIGAIATTTNWFTEQFLKREGFTNLVSSKDPVDNVRQLMEGKVKLSIFTDLTIPEIARSAGYSMDSLEPVYTVSQTYFYIAISRGTPVEVVKVWQSSLDEMKKDGTFEKIYERYLPHADMNGLLLQ